jgi:hypothetical protein
MKRSLLVAALVCAASTAWACLNDFQVRRAEQEFNAAYASAPLAPPPDPYRVWEYAFIVGGAGALLAALRAAARSPA